MKLLLPESCQKKKKGRWQNIRTVLNKGKKKRSCVFDQYPAEIALDTDYQSIVSILQPAEDKSKSVLYLSSSLLPSDNKSARRLMQQVDILFAAKLLFLSRYDEISAQNPSIILKKKKKKMTK